jgi:2-keto-3-deoxy-6-phosphogluconate aldolase
MPWTRIMPTGGVEPTEESLRKWFGAGIVACGIGSNMITKKLLDAKDYQGIEENVRQDRRSWSTASRPNLPANNRTRQNRKDYTHV